MSEKEEVRKILEESWNDPDFHGIAHQPDGAPMEALGAIVPSVKWDNLHLPFITVHFDSGTITDEEGNDITDDDAKIAELMRKYAKKGGK